MSFFGDDKKAMYQTHFLKIVERRINFAEDKKNYLKNFLEESAEVFTKELPEMKLGN